MNVRFDRGNCIGCSACSTVCPEFWSMGDDGKSRLAGGVEANGMQGWFELELKEKADEECNMRAADICPVKVIHVNEAIVRENGGG